MPSTRHRAMVVMVNFFGHAAVAGWQTASPERTLGAMLPDFASMCRVQVVAVRHAEIAAGVDLHHHTDAVFHQLRPFIELCGDTTQRLRRRGVGKGGARAGAHIAVELFLDGALLDDSKACDGYLAAIERAAGCGDYISWQQPEHGVRWEQLCARLTGYGLPRSYREPALVADRIAKILAPRPRLALNDHEASILRDELVTTRKHVLARSSELLANLCAAL